MKHDIIIIGAGPAGLSFAKNIAKTNLNVLLIEKQSKEVIANPPYDGREIALTHLSHKIMNDLEMWQIIPKEKISLIKSAKVMNGNSAYALSFDYEESGEDNLGFMISNNTIRKAAYDSLEGIDNIEILYEKEVSNVGTNSEKGWVDLKSGEHLEARLIIAADSRFSSTRRMMGISTSMLDFGRTCVVCTMSAELPHNKTAYECFHFDRTLAVLPLNDNQVSIVITLGSEDSDELLNMSKEAFAADIEKRIDARLGKMNLTSELFPYPLVATFAKVFHTERFVVIGDSAVGMHPVTAHGFNLGLQGADTLATEIKTALKTGCDWSAQDVLKTYTEKHRHVSRPLYHGTNALVRLYTKTTPAAKFARRALLRLGNHIKPAKKLIMKQLTDTAA
ncbi:MAG: ubiquinone biosynthesis protein UbiH [Micavibrio sp.]|nr:ubiquinone biosynthesis protein UbiH [Micavibrio sp.]